MARQSLLAVAATVRDHAIPELEALLRTMTRAPEAPGQADPDNPIIPFGQIEGVHFLRFVLLEDPSLPDRAAYPRLPAYEPTRLMLMVDGDGSPEDILHRLLRTAREGLVRVFIHCDATVTGTNIAAWMDRHRVRSAANYVNWPGRSARQVREEARLHEAWLAVRLAHPDTSPEELWPLLRAAAQDLPLSPPVRPALAERLGNLIHLLSLPVLALLSLPVLLPALPVLIVMLRRRETRDRVIAPRPSRTRNAMLSSLEDHDVTNPYSAIGSLKPGRFRRWLAIVILWIIDWGARHIYRSGRLARVNTIHFASWTFLDDKRRVFFASNYDGSREAYNDDFINKVAFGLNLSFSNGLGYPRTDWLVRGGARHERDFKWYLFHHQIPTQLWYNPFRGLTTYDMARNARLRATYERRPTGAELARFVAEI
ncbi:hypothetical protein [Novosphingobium profundi]|uniref:hypothetical protein n=1 Tax=Novosphingobium profundi TaxID=1774954 RepID=UPI001CFC8D31|nr:hypothetical protein [Novosphingobium profundi]